MAPAPPITKTHVPDVDVFEDIMGRLYYKERIRGNPYGKNWILETVMVQLSYHENARFSK